MFILPHSFFPLFSLHLIILINLSSSSLIFVSASSKMQLSLSGTFFILCTVLWNNRICIWLFFFFNTFHLFADVHYCSHAFFKFFKHSYFYFFMMLVTAAFKLLSAKGTVYSENQFLLPAFFFFFPMYRSQFSDLCIAQFLCWNCLF